MSKYLVGKTFSSNNTGNFKVLSYKNNHTVSIEFEDGTILERVTKAQILTGNIENKNYPSTHGIGFIGYGRRNKTAFTAWQNMFHRCYNKKFHEKHPRYKDCIVSEEWHSFQTFQNWFEENWKSYMQGWYLDRGILVKWNKMYSPKTCCFVPQEINKAYITDNPKKDNLAPGVTKRYNKFILSLNGKYFKTFDSEEEAYSVYKKHKKDCITELAEKWKDKLDCKVYETMLNY